MNTDAGLASFPHPVMLCFDGSDHAANAIAMAATVLAQKQAVVVTVAEPIEIWEPYDPSPFSAIVASLGSRHLRLDELADEIAQEQLARGLESARALTRAVCPARKRLGRG